MKLPLRALVKVTQQHITNGRTGGEATTCAVALAIRDRFPKCRDSVTVLTQNAFVRHVRYRLPPDASNFIYHFDQGGRCEPISFYMELGK